MRYSHQAYGSHHAHAGFLHHMELLNVWRQLRILTDAR
jgi:hypothetical protein